MSQNESLSTFFFLLKLKFSLEDPREGFELLNGILKSEVSIVF